MTPEDRLQEAIKQVKLAEMDDPTTGESYHHYRPIVVRLEARLRVEEAIEGVTVSFWHLSEGSWRIARPAPDGYQWVYDGRQDDSPEVSDAI